MEVYKEESSSRGRRRIRIMWKRHNSALPILIADFSSR
jgi:hypothetical protein